MLQSYKIFINDKPFLLLNKQSEIENGYFQLDPLFLAEPRIFLENEELWHSAPGFYITSVHPEEDFKAFKSNLKFIDAAGGIVRNSNEELLMIYRRGYWDLPKGKVEKGESIEKAAVREVEEETGIHSLELKEYIASTFHIYHQKHWILKETHWFAMNTDSDIPLCPQAEEDIEQAVWVAKKDIPGKLLQTYSSIREVLLQLL